MSTESMRVVALGGCGGKGRFAVRTPLGFECVEEIVAADRDGRRVQAFSVRCGPKRRAAAVDVLEKRRWRNSSRMRMS